MKMTPSRESLSPEAQALYDALQVHDAQTQRRKLAEAKVCTKVIERVLYVVLAFVIVYSFLRDPSGSITTVLTFALVAGGIVLALGVALGAFLLLGRISLAIDRSPYLHSRDNNIVLGRIAGDMDAAYERLREGAWSRVVRKAGRRWGRLYLAARRRLGAKP